MAVETIDGSAGGWCDSQAKRIVVDASLPANAQVRVLVHELAHALGVGYVAGWGEDGALAAVMEFAETIDSLARRLEDALADPEEGTDPAA